MGCVFTIIFGAMLVAIWGEHLGHLTTIEKTVLSVGALILNAAWCDGFRQLTGHLEAGSPDSTWGTYHPRNPGEAAHSFVIAVGLLVFGILWIVFFRSLGGDGKAEGWQSSWWILALGIAAIWGAGKMCGLVVTFVAEVQRSRRAELDRRIRLAKAAEPLGWWYEAEAASARKPKPASAQKWKRGRFGGLLCALGIHSWDGCKCILCARTRKSLQHNWDGCKCTGCGQTRDTGHRLVGCKCTRCGKVQHDWDGRRCTLCGEIQGSGRHSRFMVKRRRSGRDKSHHHRRVCFSHTWQGCTCTLCGTTSPDESSHSWDGCKCIRCGRTRDKGHNCDGCKCGICGQVQHDWNGCKCTRCGEIVHSLHGCVCIVCGEIEHRISDGKCIRCGRTDVSQSAPPAGRKATDSPNNQTLDRSGRPGGNQVDS